MRKPLVLLRVVGATAHQLHVGVKWEAFEGVSVVRLECCVYKPSTIAQMQLCTICQVGEWEAVSLGMK